MAVLPPLVAFLKDRTYVIDWKLFWTTFSLYAILIAIYLAIQAVRTPWKMDSNRTKELQIARDADAACRARIAELNLKFFNDRPLLGFNVHSAQGGTAWRTQSVQISV